MKRLIIPALTALTLAVNPASALQVNCPTRVDPVMPKFAIDNNIEGQVKALVRIDKGAVTDVTIISGPSVFHEAVRDAVLQYKCSTDSSTAASVTLTFDFKIEPTNKTLPATQSGDVILIRIRNRI